MMSRLRVSVAGMIVTIGMVATALAALKSATEFWLGVVSALSGVGLLVAVVRAGRGPNRAFWLGAGVTGALALAFFVGWGPTLVGPRLPGDGLIDRAHEALAPRPSWRYVSYDRAGHVTSSAIVTGSEPAARALLNRLMMHGGSYTVIPEQQALNGTGTSPASWTSAMSARYDEDLFRQIGRVLEAWIVGLAGGWVSAVVWSLRLRKRPASPP